MADVNADSQCPRCLQPFPAGSLRCPRCGERFSASPRRMLMLLGGIGAIFLLVVIALAVFLKPVLEDPDEPGRQQQEQAAPAPPAKKPVLD